MSNRKVHDMSKRFDIFIIQFVEYPFRMRRTNNRLNLTYIGCSLHNLRNSIVIFGSMVGNVETRSGRTFSISSFLSLMYYTILGIRHLSKISPNYLRFSNSEKPNFG